VIPNVPTSAPGPSCAGLEAADFVLDASPFRRRNGGLHRHRVSASCAHRDEGLRPRPRRGARAAPARFEQHLRINVTGCPNSCGQHWIADLGLGGQEIKVDGALVDAYYFCVGGAVGRIRRWRAHRPPATGDRGGTGDRAPAANFLWRAAADRELPPVRRAHTDDELRALLAGDLIEPCAATSRPSGRRTEVAAEMGYFTVLPRPDEPSLRDGGRAGPIAERRILSLLEAGAQVTVISRA